MAISGKNLKKKGIIFIYEMGHQFDYFTEESIVYQ